MQGFPRARAALIPARLGEKRCCVRTDITAVRCRGAGAGTGLQSVRDAAVLNTFAVSRLDCCPMGTLEMFDVKSKRLRGATLKKTNTSGRKESRVLQKSPCHALPCTQVDLEVLRRGGMPEFSHRAKHRCWYLEKFPRWGGFRQVVNNHTPQRTESQGEPQSWLQRCSNTEMQVM